METNTTLNPNRYEPKGYDLLQDDMAALTLLEEFQEACEFYAAMKRHGGRREAEGKAFLYVRRMALADYLSKRIRMERNAGYCEGRRDMIGIPLPTQEERECLQGFVHTVPAPELPELYHQEPLPLHVKGVYRLDIILPLKIGEKSA